ncbi:MAG: hypothetical protein J6B23_00515 [Clostridia bacterium]|nr:hypothetical protein [Clostridia bacterium]
MKKRFLAILTAAIMLLSVMPTAMAATIGVQWSANVHASVTFSSFVKNTATISGINSGSASGVRLSGAGTAVDYEPVGGLFGKATDDIAVKATRIPSSTSAAFISPQAKMTANYCTGPGEYIDVNWEWAFGDMNVERYVNAAFYNSYSHAWNVVNSFAYTSGGTMVNDILRVSPNGTIRFFGKILPNNYFFEKDTWYNFDIRIKRGKDTVVDSATGEVTEAGSKAVATLYIDGIQVGQKEINNAKDDVTNITNPHCIYTIEFTSKGAKYANASEAFAETTYIDNIYAGKYKGSPNHIAYPWMRDYTIASKSDNFITDGIHIALKNPMTASELKADLAYANMQSATIVDANRQALASDDLVTPGCFIKCATASNSETHYWYRKIVDNITYLDNNFEGVEPGYSPGGQYDSVLSEWSDTCRHGVEEIVTPAGITKAMKTEKFASAHSSALHMKYYTGYKGTINADKYVIEASVLRDGDSAEYPEIRYTFLNGRVVATIGVDTAIYAKEDGDEWPAVIKKGARNDNRWFKFVLEVDQTTEKGKIYINGVDTGIERTVPTADKWYSNFGIFTNCENKLATAFGKTYIDDIKIYSGTYSDGLSVTSNSDKIVIASNDTIKLEENVTAEELIAATGADAIYTYADGEFGDQITAGVLPGNAVAVFKSDDTNIVKYYDIVYAPVMGDVTFDTSVAGKISAKVTFDNNSDLNMYKAAKLIIASYDNSGKGKKLVAVNFDAKNDMIVGENNLTATIDFDESKEIVAYLWKANGAPYIEAVPYIAE